MGKPCRKRELCSPVCRNRRANCQPSESGRFGLLAARVLALETLLTRKESVRLEALPTKDSLCDIDALRSFRDLNK